MIDCRDSVCRSGGAHIAKFIKTILMMGAGVVGVPCGSTAAAPQAGSVVTLEQPLGSQGSICVRVQTDRGYHNGPDVKAVRIDVLEVPGIGRLGFRESSTVCELKWTWATGVAGNDLAVELPRLPGPDVYFIQYTWNAPAGRFTGYVNGAALCLPNTRLRPWKLPNSAEIHMAEGPFKTTLVSAEPHSLDEAQARSQVPASIRDRHAELFGVRAEEPAPIEVASRLGKLLYATALDTPGSIEGWVMEGPGRSTFEEGWMTMASSDPESPAKLGHIVHWCPHDFPARFVAEWEMQVRSEEGLCIVFFAARGLQGEDIFDPALPQRTGVFRQYTQGGINCYHISYYANTPTSPGRITSNIRKNSGFYLVANGPPGIEPESDTVHALRLIKDGAHIQLQVDEHAIIDFMDDGPRYGPALGGGKIGLRQMQWTTARYRNFRVHELLRETGSPFSQSQSN